MEINNETYKVVYDATTTTVVFHGMFRLRGMPEYEPIMELLDKVVAQNPANLTLNLRGLQFLNSSGINMLSQFVIKMHEQKNIQLTVLGAPQYAWQTKSLRNLQRLMPKLKLEFRVGLHRDNESAQSESESESE